MLQPSQLPAYLRFLGLMVLLIAIFIATFIWGLRKTISTIQKLPDFTQLEVAIVRRQILALLIGMPLVVLFLVLSPLGWNLRQPFIFFLALIIGFVPLTYISVTSIRNHVSIFSSHKGIPDKGPKAVWSGVINLVFIVLVFTGYAIYFASLK